MPRHKFYLLSSMQSFLKDFELSIGLTQDDYADFGKFVAIYNSAVEDYSGHFNWTSEKFVFFCKSNGITQKGTKQKRVQENHFWFDAQKTQKMELNDFAHHFLRHIRNSFSHGNIVVYREKKNRKYYEIKDYKINDSGLSQTMSGRIRSDLLWGMIEILLGEKR